LQEFLTRVKPKQRKYFTELRSALLALPEIQESIEIDELRGDWCPAYRVRGSDLVWVHFDEQLWLSVPVEPKFGKKVFQDENLDSQVVERIKDAEDVGEVKYASLQIRSAEQLDQVIPLLRLRHSVLTA
jgi:chorismate mutase